MHQNLYPEIVLTAAILLTTIFLFLVMVIAAIVSILLEHRAEKQAKIRFIPYKSAKSVLSKNKD